MDGNTFKVESSIAVSIIVHGQTTLNSEKEESFQRAIDTKKETVVSPVFYASPDLCCAVGMSCKIPSR